MITVSIYRDGQVAKPLVMSHEGPRLATVSEHKGKMVFSHFDGVCCKAARYLENMR